MTEPTMGSHGAGASASAGADGFTPQAATDMLYGHRNSCDERFGSIRGQERYKVCEANYLMSDNLVVFPFGKGGERLLTRHPTVNPRQTGGAVAKYAAEILQHGVMTKMRSRLMGVPTQQGPSPTTVPGGGDKDFQSFFMIAGATLCEARLFFLAFHAPFTCLVMRPFARICECCGTMRLSICIMGMASCGGFVIPF